MESPLSLPTQLTMVEEFTLGPIMKFTSGKTSPSLVTMLAIMVEGSVHRLIASSVQNIFAIFTSAGTQFSSITQLVVVEDSLLWPTAVWTSVETLLSLGTQLAGMLKESMQSLIVMKIAFAAPFSLVAKLLVVVEESIQSLIAM